MESWRSAKGALEAQGFSLVTGAGRDLFRGHTKIGSVDVSLEIEISDYEFLELPKIRVLEREKLPKRLSVHIVSDGTLCYADRATVLLDRFHPDRSIISCLEMARSTLSTLLHGNPSPAYMAELTAYWSTTPYFLIDEPTGLTHMVLGLCVFDNEAQFFVAGASEARLVTWVAKARGKFLKQFEAPVVHAVDVIRPPSNETASLKGVTDWLEPQVICHRPLIDVTIGKAKNEPALVVAASNALIGFRAKKTPLLTRSHKRGFRKSALPSIWKKEAHQVELETFHCVPTSLSEISARNLDKPAPLSDQSIALIGCGTIGSHLARALVQIGAGQNERMMLIDQDELRPENLGRHALGVRHLGKNKAIALKDQLVTDFPDARLEAVDVNAQGTFDRLAGYDLVIDATGDEQFSNALNAFALAILKDGRRFPPILFAMLFGNGLAAQTYLTRWNTGSACYRCLKPLSDSEWRFNPLKPNAGQTTTAIRPCSVGAFIPYSVAASMQAAALAAAHVSEFFSESYTHDLRTMQIDPTVTKNIPFKNVKRAESCPICSR